MNPNREAEKGIDDERMEMIAKLNKTAKLNMIKNMFTNLANLANLLDETRPDIAMVIDSIKMGASASLKDLEPNTLCGFFKNNIVQHQASTGIMNRITMDDGVVHHDMDPVIIRKTFNGLLITPVPVRK